MNIRRLPPLTVASDAPRFEHYASDWPPNMLLSCPSMQYLIDITFPTIVAYTYPRRYSTYTHHGLRIIPHHPLPYRHTLSLPTMYLLLPCRHPNRISISRLVSSLLALGSRNQDPHTNTGVIGIFSTFFMSCEHTNESRSVFARLNFHFLHIGRL